MAKRIRYFICFILTTLLLYIYSFASSEFDGYVVKFKDSDSEKAALDLLSEISLFTGSDEDILSEVNNTMGIYKTYDESVISELYELGLIEFAEPDYLCELHTYDYTEDNYFLSQWAHKATNIQRAWELGAYGQGATIAVIDTGVRSSHQDLTDNLLEGSLAPDFESADTSDPHGHGTAVSGVIAAAANGSGVVGTAHRVNVIPIKVPLTEEGKVLTSTLASAIFNTVLYYEPDVINISIGYSGTEGNTHEQITLAVNKALSCGTIVVCSAGNYNVNTYVYPASLDGVVSVSSIKKVSGNYTHSDYTYNDKITIAAPGENVYSTSNSSNTSYAIYNGTSFASPYVAAVAGIAKSIDPDIRPEHFIELLIQTSNKSVLEEGAERDDYYGYGILDAGALIEALINEKSDGLYFSPADYRTDGGFTVTAYNAGQAPLNLSFIAKGENLGKPLGFDVKTVTLSKSDTLKISLPPSVAALSTDISLYILNPFTYAPWRLPIKY